MSSSNQLPISFPLPIYHEERSTLNDFMLPTVMEVPKMPPHPSSPLEIQKHSLLHGILTAENAKSGLSLDRGDQFALSSSSNHNIGLCHHCRSKQSLIGTGKLFGNDFSKQHEISPLSFNNELIRLLRNLGHEKKLRQLSTDNHNKFRENRLIWPFKIRKNGFACRKIAKLRSLASRGAQKNAKKIIKKQLQSLHCFLKEQEASSGCHISESLLSELAKRHPDYEQVVRALPLLMKMVPEGFKELMTGETRKLFKTCMVIVKQWSPT